MTLRSAVDGFKTASGDLLDGNGDGVASDNFEHSFSVAPLPTEAITVAARDFVRGPGQQVNLPADGTGGIPLTISEGTNVRAIDLRISYDPALLEITGATVGEEVPAGASLVLNNTTPGLAILVFFSATSLQSGGSTFANLEARVPTTGAGEILPDQQLLDLHAVTISDGSDNEFPVVVDDALHASSYFGDVSGNGRINASDAAQVARFAALIDAGFSSSPLIDPILIGDISGNGRVNAADASMIARFAALIDVPEIPPIPAGNLAARTDGGPRGIDSHKWLADTQLTDSGVSHSQPAGMRDSVTEPDEGANDSLPALPATVGDSAANLSTAVDRIITEFDNRAGVDEQAGSLEELLDELLGSRFAIGDLSTE